MRLVKEKIPTIIGGEDSSNQDIEDYLAAPEPAIPVEDDAGNIIFINSISQLPESLYPEFRLYISKIHEFKLTRQLIEFPEYTESQKQAFTQTAKDEIAECLQEIKFIQNTAGLSDTEKELLSGVRSRIELCLYKLS